MLKDADKSGAGVLKLEKFMEQNERTHNHELPAGSVAYIEIDGAVATVDASAPFTLNTDIDGDSEVKTVVVYDGSILATGKQLGRQVRLLGADG